MTQSDEDRPGANARQIGGAGALFHLPKALASAYGGFEGHDLSSARGLLQYLVDFVNRKPKRPATLPYELPIGRTQLQRLFHAAVHGPASPDEPDLASPPSDALIVELNRRASGIRWEPRLERVSSGAEWRHHAFVESFDALYTLVVTLLTDERIRRDLAQCGYCNKFFIANRGTRGRPELRYCPGSTHREEANSADSADRQRRVRARKLIGAKYGSREAVQSAVEQALKNHPEAKSARELADRAIEFLQTARKHK